MVNRLAERLPALELCISGRLPPDHLQQIFTIPFTHIDRAQDVGLVQPDPLTVDLAATRHALAALHDNWEQRLALERRTLRDWSPDLLLADIPYLPIAAASHENIPSAAIASLSWDHVLAAYLPLSEPTVHHWWSTMRAAYRLTDLALLPEPAIDGGTFPNPVHIAPITRRGRNRRQELRKSLRLADDDHRPLILVSLGGIPSNSIPTERLCQEPRFHWLLNVPLPDLHPGHLHDVDEFPHWPFADLIASADAIVSKPGYGMAISAVAHDRPFLFSRRGHFPDEPFIAAYLQNHGRAIELDRTHFQTGDWYQPLQTLLSQPPKKTPSVDGAEQAAQRLLDFL